MDCTLVIASGLGIPRAPGNTLSQFETVFVLVSIVLGLGLANLLNSLATVSQLSWRTVDPIHVAFSCGMVLEIFVVWWGMCHGQGHGPFAFGTFAVIGLDTSVFYSFSVILFPRDGRIQTFDEIRFPFYIALTLYLFLELAYSAVGQFAPAGYYYSVWMTGLLLFMAGIAAKKRWMDGVIVVFWFALFSSRRFIAKLS